MDNRIQSRAHAVLKLYRQTKRLKRHFDRLAKEMLGEIGKLVETYHEFGLMLPLNITDNSEMFTQLEADIYHLEKQLNRLRRNYTVSRSLGKSWEDGLRGGLPLKRDTKLEIVYLAGKYIQVPKPMKHDFTRLEFDSPAPVYVETITLEFKQWIAPDSQRRFIAFSDELNTLYVRQG
jgi:hypothetical protein